MMSVPKELHRSEWRAAQNVAHHCVCHHPHKRSSTISRELWPRCSAIQSSPESATKLLRLGERVAGAIPATETKMSTRVLSGIPFVRIVLIPLQLYRLFKSPLKAIVWTNQRHLVMTRCNLLNFTGRSVRKIDREVAKGQPLERTSHLGHVRNQVARPAALRSGAVHRRSLPTGKSEVQGELEPKADPEASSRSDREGATVEPRCSGYPPSTRHDSMDAIGDRS